MEERLIRIEEVAMLLDVNQYTIERWYKFKRENPDNEYAKLLPEFIYKVNSKNRNTRYWKASDVEQLKKFEQSIVQGVNGFMGSVTNNKKKEKKKDGSKKRK